MQDLFLANFSGAAEVADQIPQRLDDPLSAGYRTVLLVAERPTGKVVGFALLLHFTDAHFAFLDFMAVAGGLRGGGVGGALYEAVREFCRGVGCHGLYLEALPDNPLPGMDEATLAENRKRLRFYERYSVLPVVGTAYETPIGEGPAPMLLFDGLGRTSPLRRKEAQAAVRLILSRKYAAITDRKYIRLVVESFTDDPVRLRPPRYIKRTAQKDGVATGRLAKPFALFITREHIIHHVHDTGYVERPTRVNALAEAVQGLELFQEQPIRHYGDQFITAVHDAEFLAYLKKVCKGLPPNKAVYPYVFPVRRPERRPRELAVRAGYYCIDTFTPLTRNAFDAARKAVDAALSGADAILKGAPVAYVLCRPPGHHAEHRLFGGFCYMNNSAIAANRLSAMGRTAVLDIDFHHGNGTQDIFYRRGDVLTVSIHGHPNHAYPYFSGFADETGEGEGKGANLNLPLPENTGGRDYLAALDEALRRIGRFAPQFLVVSLGFDTMAGDPTGSFRLSARALEEIGRKLASLRRPLLLVQEGGYSIANLKRGAKALFRGVASRIR
ncbi:histone deacetylase family protein [Dissulfurirhabdus thermomarina]|uniref:histone deacetylase family protein n=1 Tax=Dissulfurirhabdus thermomarina TaxID=1765737 RepID=UPI002852E675|nr:histone deacetylase family protein [Dissulfurirhabdus thermomarina]